VEMNKPVIGMLLGVVIIAVMGAVDDVVALNAWVKLVFQVVAVMLLPLIWELDGIWISIVVAEVMAVVVTVLFVVGLRKKYHY